MNEDFILTDQQYRKLSVDICERIVQEKKVRRTLPGGRLHIDRKLPFLCVYRTPQGKFDEGTHRLVMGEASYLVVNGARKIF